MAFSTLKNVNNRDYSGAAGRQNALDITAMSDLPLPLIPIAKQKRTPIT
jgi:hypothetical protein